SSTSAPSTPRTNPIPAASAIAAVANKLSVSALVQPQSPPLDTASSRQTSVTPMPRAPSGSNPPVPWGFASGTRNHTPAATTATSTATPRNMIRQLVYCTTAAEIGNPSAPPMPSEALITAIELPSRSAGSTSRMTLMPSGMMPAPMPCRPRPMIIGTTEEDAAHTSGPMNSGTMQINSMRFLP